MSLDAIVTQLLMGLTVGANLVLVATGLTLVFGMMGVINFAHSALFMLGAYVGYAVVARIGSFWLGLVLAPLAIGLLGAAVERFLLRSLRERFPLSHLLPLLLTFGLSLFFEGSAKFVWGADIVSLDKPRLLSGAVTVGRISFPTYWIFALLAAAALALAVWVLVEQTSLGLAIRAATQDAMMAAVLGVNVQRLNTVVFGLGAALAGAAGVILGTMTSVSPQMGAGIVLDAFIAIVIGGLGSFTGAIVGALLLGQVQSFGIALFPAFHTPLVFLVMAIVLVLRPSGLFGVAARR
jgi:branched-chain amino acid transport system permease protein